jgi:hypothetical protein
MNSSIRRAVDNRENFLYKMYERVEPALPILGPVMIPVGMIVLIISLSPVLLCLCFLGSSMIGSGIYGTYVSIDRAHDPVKDAYCSSDYTHEALVVDMVIVGETDNKVVFNLYKYDSLNVTFYLSLDEIIDYGIDDAYQNNTLLPLYKSCKPACDVGPSSSKPRARGCGQYHLQRQKQEYDAEGYGALAATLIGISLVLCIPTCVVGILGAIGGVILALVLSVLVVVLVLVAIYLGLTIGIVFPLMVISSIILLFLFLCCTCIKYNLRAFQRLTTRDYVEEVTDIEEGDDRTSQTSEGDTESRESEEESTGEEEGEEDSSVDITEESTEEDTTGNTDENMGESTEEGTAGDTEDSYSEVSSNIDSTSSFDVHDLTAFRYEQTSTDYDDVHQV